MRQVLQHDVAYVTEDFNSKSGLKIDVCLTTLSLYFSMGSIWNFAVFVNMKLLFISYKFVNGL